jgi:hypothetical protein
VHGILFDTYNNALKSSKQNDSMSFLMTQLSIFGAHVKEKLQNNANFVGMMSSLSLNLRVMMFGFHGKTLGAIPTLWLVS